MNAQLTSLPTSASRRNPVVRFISSIWFGVSMLAAVLIYCSIMSAIPRVRGAMELSEMEAYRHWLFVLLIALFCISLIAATWTRIRWNIVNLGVLTVHAGLLVLAGGAIWYFGTKIEGDTLLQSPRIEVLGPGGQVLPGGQMLAEAGQSWERFMPAFGGRVRVDVLDTRVEGKHSVAEATVRVQIGEQGPETSTLAADGRQRVEVSDRLSVRLTLPGPVRSFYSESVPALYYGPANRPRAHMAAIEGLPLFRERYLDEGYTITDRAGRPVPSKRTSPHVNLAGLKIPTGWFEHWRLPIRLNTPELPFDVEITGYLPYVTSSRLNVIEGGSEENPAARIELRAGSQTLSEWLLANDPSRSILQTVPPFEFRWVQSEQERDALLEPLAGPHELTVKVLDPPVEETYQIQQGQTIEVEGTPYKLTIKQLARSWPLMTPGYDGASSPMASVDVTNGEKSYNRTVIQRFPHLSQDIDETGERHKTGPYDPNLILRYRTAGDGWVLVIAGPGIDPVVGVIDRGGRLERVPVGVGQSQHLDVGRLHVDFRLASLVRAGREVMEPVVEPLERRRPNIAPRSASAIRLNLTGRGPLEGWSESRWCLFSQYPHQDARPLHVRPPGSDSEYVLTYSRLMHDLGAALIPRRLFVKLFPGGRSPEFWRSDFLVLKDGADAPVPATVQTNETHSVGRWTLFQSGAAQDHWSYTILGVGNRNGINTMLLGCVLITLGCLYAFYVKPVLRKRQQERALSQARQRVVPGRKPEVPRREPVEVGS